jgi:predicted N-acetyltransferase YhbS
VRQLRLQQIDFREAASDRLPAHLLLDRMPFTLLARLAVDRRSAGPGLGDALISEALRISLRVADEVGCRCVITDAYRDRISWYSRYGLVPI